MLCLHTAVRWVTIAAICLHLQQSCQAAAPYPREAGLSVLGTIQAGDGSFDHAVVDPDSEHLYVARGFGVTSIDLTTGQVDRRSISGSHVHSMMLLSGNRLLFTDGAASTASIVDTRSGRILSIIPCGDKPDAAVFDPVSGLVLVMNARSKDVTLIDPLAMKSVGRIPLGGAPESAVADGDGQVFVNLSDEGAIARLVVTGRRLSGGLSGRYALPGCLQPSGLAIDRKAGILISACDNRVALAVRIQDGRVLKRIGIDRVPDDVIFDPGRQSFFIPCARDASLVAITEQDGGSFTVSRTHTAIGAHTAALDTRTGRLYLPAADFTIVPGGYRQVPHTFRIFIVGQSQ